MNKELLDILNNQGVIFAYLFGSQAKGDTHANSDIDLAIFLPEFSETSRFETKLYLMGRLPSKIGKKVDIVVLNDLQNNYLLKEILHTGKLIINNDDDLHFDFITRKQHEICDFFEHLRYMEKYVLS
jgi:predicted nucleotidyltransferase